MTFDNTIYANDAYAQALLKGAQDIAKSNTVDPIAFDEAYKDLEPALLAGSNILIFGPPQNGKSTAVALIANKYGIPFIPFSCDDGLQPSAVFGSQVPNPNKGVNGDDREFVWEDGPLLRAWRNGYWFDAEEILQLPPERASMFMKVLDKMPFFVTKQGEVVQRHPNFRFIATGNPLCRGNKKQNQALLRRFDTKIFVRELTDRGFLLLGKSKFPNLKDGFFISGYMLSRAIVAEAERLGHPGESCGITQLTALVGILENESVKIDLSSFRRKVANTFVNVLGAAQIEPDLVDAFISQKATSDIISRMFNDYVASPKPIPQGQQASGQKPSAAQQPAADGQTPQPQPAANSSSQGSSGTDLLESLWRSRI